LEEGIAPFELVTIKPAHAHELNGSGTNIDSIAFLEHPDPTETLMFVTGKGNNRVEVWKYPFAGSEQDPIRFSQNVNGVVVDQR
jgi:hypothetical protein